jgi:hypothetical protein
MTAGGAGFFLGGFHPSSPHQKNLVFVYTEIAPHKINTLPIC